MYNKKNLFAAFSFAAFAMLFVFSSCRRQSQVHDYRSKIAESEKYLDDNPDSAKALLIDAYRLSMSQYDNAGISESCLDICRWHGMFGQYDSARVWIERGLPYSEGIDSIRARYYAELTFLCAQEGDLRKSVYYARKALPIMKKYNDIDLAMTCGNAGVSYRKLGNNDSSVVFYQEGIEAALQTEDYESVAFLSNGLSIVYGDMKRYDEAIDYTKKAEQAARKIGDKIERLSALANRGAMLYYMGEQKKSVNLLEAVWKETKSTESIQLKLKVINYILGAIQESDDIKKIAYYYHIGEDLTKDLPAKNLSATWLLNSKFNLQCSQGNYKEALNTLNEIESLKPGIQVMPENKMLFGKAKCLAGLGRYSEAYHDLVNAYAISDSLHSCDTDKKLSELSVRYNVLEKELEVARLNEQAAESQKRIGWLLIALVSTLAVIAILVLWMHHRKQKAEIRESKKYIDGIESERARFARELHDGACNDLLAIGMKLHSADSDMKQVVNDVSTLRAQLRNISHELMPPQFAEGVNIDETLRYYLSHIDKPEVTYKSEGSSFDNVPKNVAYEFYRITQEAIGNIIVHQPEGKAEVFLSYIGNILLLDVVSSGEFREGCDKGIGLQSMRDRANSISAILEIDKTDNKFYLSVKTEI